MVDVVDKNEELIREFIDFLGWKGRPKLQTMQITNNSSNDYMRELTNDEVEKLISDFINQLDV